MSDFFAETCTIIARASYLGLERLEHLHAAVGFEPAMAALGVLRPIRLASREQACFLLKNIAKIEC